MPTNNNFNNFINDEFDEEIAVIKQNRVYACIWYAFKMGLVIALACAAVTVAMRYSGIGPNGWINLLIGIAALLIFGVKVVSHIPSIEDAIQKVERQREADKKYSARLQQLYEEIPKLQLSHMKVDEPLIRGDRMWKPFRVEHAYGSNTNLELRGSVFLGGSQLSIQKLLREQISKTEAGAGLLLESEGKTAMRVLIPSTAFVRAVFSPIVQQYLDFTQRSGPDKNPTWPNCHRALLKFRTQNYRLPDSIYPLEVMDAIDLACQPPFFLGERPKVQVKGVEIHNAVLATALIVDGQEHVLLPTTLSRKIRTELAQIMGPLLTATALDALK